MRNQITVNHTIVTEAYTMMLIDAQDAVISFENILPDAIPYFTKLLQNNNTFEIECSIKTMAQIALGYTLGKHRGLLDEIMYNDLLMLCEETSGCFTAKMVDDAFIEAKRLAALIADDSFKQGFGPDAMYWCPDPDYIRKLIDMSGFGIKEVGRYLAAGGRAMRAYVAPRSSSSSQTCPYAVQFCLQTLAHDREQDEPVTEAAEDAA
jgi:hypothetical protein